MQADTLSSHSNTALLELLFPLILMSSQLMKRVHYIIQCEEGKNMHLSLLKSFGLANQICRPIADRIKYY